MEINTQQTGLFTAYAPVKIVTVPSKRPVSEGEEISTVVNDSSTWMQLRHFILPLGLLKHTSMSTCSDSSITTAEWTLPIKHTEYKCTLLMTYPLCCKWMLMHTDISFFVLNMFIWALFIKVLLKVFWKNCTLVYWCL